MNEPRPRLLLATNNKAKVGEYSVLLQGLAAELTSLAEQGITATIEETGHTMEENALLKARFYAAISGLLTIADDSGLEVDALGGEPGVRSARYAGDGASDSARIELLLSRLEGVPWDKRTARFRCVIAVAGPGGQVEVCEGVCPGYITFAPQGDQGFGYDPVFYLPDLGRTMAQLTMEEKNQVSHRGQAARKARGIIEGKLKNTILGKD